MQIPTHTCTIYTLLNKDANEAAEATLLQWLTLTHRFLIIHACFKICLISLLGKGSSNTVNISFSLINGSYFLLQYYLNSKCWNACEMTCLTKTQKFLLFFLEHWIEICSCQLQVPNEMAHNIKIIEVVNHRSRWSGDIVMPHSEIHVKNPIPRSSDIFAVFNHFSI